MSSYLQQEEFLNRLHKLSQVQEAGVEPYPHRFSPSCTAQSIFKSFIGENPGTSEEAALKKTPDFCLAGRLVLFRPMGKNAFAHIQDSSGKIQILFNRDFTKVVGLSSEDKSPLKFIEKKIDIGDIIGVKGNLFRTQKGELTVFVHEMTLLCKTLLPLPEKHKGLVDKEIRYRKRWLDLISHDEIKKVFLLRSHMMCELRKYLESAGFIEVETPILQTSYGGAAARPFETKVHAIDADVFMRISLEISLKKLLIGGFDRVFEIGKVFRNEGIDKTHNPEFTMIEAYAAYWDYNDMMTFVETLVEHIAFKLLGTTQLVRMVEGKEVVVDVKAPWKRLTMKESIAQYAQIDVDTASDHELLKFLQDRVQDRLGKEVTSSMTKGLLIAEIFEECVVSKLIQPHHIMDHPIETTPLCKPHRDSQLQKEGFVERFESFIMGEELCNAYTELNDPVMQRLLFEEQAEQLKAGDKEAHPMDEEFLEAICQGFPPSGGLGIGIDRLVMLLTNSESIRDVLFFPLMKKARV